MTAKDQELRVLNSAVGEPLARLVVPSSGVALVLIALTLLVFFFFVLLGLQLVVVAPRRLPSWIALVASLGVAWPAEMVIASILRDRLPVLVQHRLRGWLG